MRVFLRDCSSHYWTASCTWSARDRRATPPLCSGKGGRKHHSNTVPQNPWRSAGPRRNSPLFLWSNSVKLTSLHRAPQITYSSCQPVIQAPLPSVSLLAALTPLGQWLGDWGCVWGGGESLGPYYWQERDLCWRAGVCWGYGSHSLILSAWHAEKDIRSKFGSYYSFPGGSDSKESASNAGTQVQSLGWEDSLEKAMATHSRILAWIIPWTEEPELQSQTQWSN